MRRVLRTGTNLLVRLSQDPSYAGVGDRRAALSVVARSEREGGTRRRAAHKRGSLIPIIQ